VSRQVRRFTAAQRVTHGLLMLSFLGLVATGMPLLFAHAGWARAMGRAMGGFQAMGTAHRALGILLVSVFLFHVGQLLFRVFVRKEAGLLWGPDSLVPQPSDLRQMLAHIRWFVGRGAPPAFDRYTYWEKFDYFAVFWGMVIIGGSGFVLWFHELFSRLLPGWIFNVALLVHGEEALLAAGFIFTIHFFNSHLRPEKFPMDLVIFTGRVDEEELARERPLEHARLVAAGRLEEEVVPPAPRWLVRLGKVVGSVAVLTGVALFVLILTAVLGE
jgi:cytochrome b subunit of formate dehydrogenase